MGKIEGRKILGVILFCFVLSAVHGLPVHAIRNNLYPVVPSSNDCFSPFVQANTAEIHSLEAVSNGKDAMLRAVFSPTIHQRNLELGACFQNTISSDSYLTNNGFLFFGFICILASFFLVRRPKAIIHPGLILLLLLLFAFTRQGQAQSQTFPDAGNFTFTPPAGVTSVTVEAWGGGGGGAAVSHAAGGGGGGAYTKGTLTNLVPGTAIEVTVGAGGAAGSNGQASKMETITANGGSAGNVRTGGAGGTASVIGGIIIASFAGGAGGNAMGSTAGVDDEAGGGGGASAISTAMGNNGGTATSATGGAGGTGTGAGGRGADGDGTPDAVEGTIPGGGGGGRGEGTSTSKAGAMGRVIVTWVCPEDAGVISTTEGKICTVGGSAQLSSTVPGGVWSSNNTAIAEIDPTTGAVTAKSSGGGTVRMTYTIPAFNGCPVQTASLDLIVENLTTVSAGPAITPICQGATSDPLGGSYENATTAVWSDGGAGGSFLYNTGSTPNTTRYIATATSPASVTLTLTASGGSCGPTSITKNITVNPTIGNTTFTAGKTTVCQNDPNETYTATAANSTSIAYSVSPVTAGSMNSATGVMDWNTSFQGTATITATATGLCGTTSATRAVTVNPSLGAVSFTAGGTIVCQNAANETYTATAANSTSMAYSVSPSTAGAINASTGVMDWDAAFFGTATITATATGLCGTTSATRTVTVNPSTGATSFTAGATTVCQNAANETYTATAANSTSMAYSVLPAAAGSINASTGVMDWDASFYGTATITATATGLCGTTSAIRTVTVNPSTGATSFTAGAMTVCQDAANETYTATAANSTSMAFSVSPATAGTMNSATGVMDWNAAFSGTATITATATGLCGTTNATRTVTVHPTPTVTTPGNQTFCQGDPTNSITLSGTPSGVVFDITGGAGVGLANQTGMTAIPSFTPIAGIATITLTPRANGCSGSPINFFITVHEIPTLTGASQQAAVCAGSAAVINLTGLKANSTNTIAYSINGIAQTPVTGVAANASGNGSFTTTALAAAHNGQTLQITGVTITSISPNCSAAFTRNVTLAVHTAPTITQCPSPSISLNTSAGGCTAAGTYTVSASGLPAPTLTYTFTGATTGSGTGTGTGSTFNAGTTNVKVTATNSCGTAECTFTVIVTDNVAPVLSACPSNITVSTGANRTSCDQTATWTEPTATDNCTPVGNLAWTKSHVPGSVFPVGTTTVTYRVKDAAGNEVSCSFDVIVTDNTKPTFNAPIATSVNVAPDCTVNISPSAAGSVTGLFDNCTPSASLTVTHSDGPTIPVAAGCAYPYQFTRTWKVTDAAGNFEEKTQIITVRDLVKPILSVPATIAISCSQSSLPAVIGTATATDNCSATVAVSYSDNVTSGNCGGNSVIIRTWTATDCSGNISTGIQTINVNDNTKPTGSIPEIYASCASTIPPAYAGYAQFIAAGGSATDNCGSVTVVLLDEISNGLEGKPGYCPTSLTRTYRITDECGNFLDVVQTVRVGTECPCTYCTDGTEFHMVDLLGNPDGQITFNNVDRDGKCCNEADWWTQPGNQNIECVSFNVRIDDDAVGVEIYFEKGAKPGSKDWRVDCKAVDVTSGIVCLAPGSFHLFTYCKQGGNDNQITFRSIKGAVSSGNLDTRVDCSDELHVSGVNSPTWNSISPGARGAYNSYLDITDPFNPKFNAPANSPAVIQYEVCGTFGNVLCGTNTISTDCDIVTVNVKPKIAIEWNVDPQVICEGHIPEMVADVTPSSVNYLYEWFSGYDAQGTPLYSGSNKYTPTSEGPFSIRVTDVQSGIHCSSQEFNFDIAYDKTGPSLIAPPAPLTVECNDPMASQKINDWLASATATYIDATGTTVEISPTNNFTSINMACGTVLTITFTVADQCTNTTSTTSTITITDTQAPIWSSAAGSLNRTVSCSDAAGLAAAQALAPVATDLCDPSLTLTKTSGALVAGACPNTGTYTNTWIARDDCNIASTVYTQTITITDNTPPVITTQAQNESAECDGSGNTAALNTWIASHGGAVATDDCGSPVTWTNSSPVFTDLCGLTGMATVTFTATDACGNSATTQASFTITDTQAPAITCPAPTTGTTDNNECYSTTIVLGTPTASDNCSAPVIFTNNAPARFPSGVTTVTWTATDACGNQSTCTQVVTVTDNNQPPVIQCQANVEEFITDNNCSKIPVNITPPVITDNCPDPVLSWTLTGATVASGVGPIPATQAFNVGKTRVHYTVTDAGMHTDTCSFQVWTRNLVAPKFNATCPAITTITEDAPLNQCTAAVTIPAPTIFNPCNEIYTVTNNSPFKTSNADASGNYPVGTTIVTWTITDASGNVKNCIQTIIVNDKQAPVITCQSNVTEEISGDACFKTVITVTDPVVTDNCNNLTLTYVLKGATTGSGNGSASGLTFNVGKTRVYYTVTDGTNTDTCSFQVWVKNLDRPKFKVTCSSTTTITEPAAPGSCTASVTVPAPVVDNPCNEAFTMVNSFNNTNNANGNYPVGTTNVIWTITDASGNVKTCEQTVIVTDNQAPEITCQSNVTEEISDDSCFKTVIFLSDPVVTDNCNNLTLTYVLTGATTGNGEGSASALNYNIGKTRVHYTITDGGLNKDTCSFQVWVKNLDRPQFSSACPANVSVSADAGNCDALVTVPAPVITNPCNEAYTVTNNSPFKTSDTDASGTYPIGITSFTWVITDASGIKKECIQTVTVNDLPLTCPEDILLPAGFNLPYAANVSVSAPVFSSNCTALTLTWSRIAPDGSTTASPLTGINIIPSTGTYYIGTTTITYTLTHATGVKETCSFDIIINSPPEITCPDIIPPVEADPGLCTAAVTIVPATATGSGVTVTGVRSDGLAITDTYPVGTTTITWTATNASGTDVCTQTIIVRDTQKPTFDLPAPLSECVESLISAVYSPSDMDIDPDRPDYYVFVSGDRALDLDPATFSDNCLLSICTPEIRWQITMDNGNLIPATGAITGQPSTYGSNIAFLGDGVTFQNVVHTITYWIVDCNDQVSDPRTQTITVKPRPNIIKTTN